MFSELVKEREAIAGTPVYPQSLNNANGTTGTVDLSKFQRVSFIGGIGTKLTGSSVWAYLQGTNNSNGTSATNIAGAIITNIVNQANVAFTIELNATQTGARYVVGVIGENAGLAATCFLIPIGEVPRNRPQVSDDASVLQRVSVVSN